MSQRKTSWGWMFWRGVLSCRSAANTKETLIFSYIAWSLHIRIELGIFSCSLVVYGWELNSVFYLRSCTPSAWDIYSGSSGLWVSQFSEFLLCFFCVDTHLPLLTQQLWEFLDPCYFVWTSLHGKSLNRFDKAALSLCLSMSRNSY